MTCLGHRTTGLAKPLLPWTQACLSECQHGSWHARSALRAIDTAGGDELDLHASQMHLTTLDDHVLPNEAYGENTPVYSLDYGSVW